MSLEKDFFTHLFYKKIFFYTSNENVCITMIKKKGKEDIQIVLSKNRRKEVLFSFSFRIYIFFS